MSECKSADVTTQFVRDVKASPEPAVVLATDQQLEDLVHFCTSVEEFCVPTVDPTFSLGDFEVTLLAYCHLMLKTSRTEKQPENQVILAEFKQQASLSGFRRMCGMLCYTPGTVLHEKGGLRNPPEVFTINANKSLNTAIKSKVDFQKKKLNKFIEKMRCLVDDQQKEVQQAVCCQAKYTFCCNYQFLEFNMNRWFTTMPEAQSTKYIIRL